MTAAEKIDHWGFKLMALGLMGSLALVAAIIVTVQIWLIVYYNPWGFSLFPLKTIVLLMVSAIIVCMAASFIGILWNSSL